MDWAKVLDLEGALKSLASERYGEWYSDPWSWPELDYMAKVEPDLIFSHASASTTRSPALIDVPKENWGTRPAVVLDPVDRLTYQALVDRQSVRFIGDLSDNVYGWRLRPGTSTPADYSHNDIQWNWFHQNLSLMSRLYPAALKTDVVSCFASIPIDQLCAVVLQAAGSNAVSKRICSMLRSFAQVERRSGVMQRSLASSVLVNLYLRPVDDALSSYSAAMPKRVGRKSEFRSCARWMDDIWLFASEASYCRRVQIELQDILRDLGLNVNSSKTDVLEGADLIHEVLELEQSGVDSAIGQNDLGPLDDLLGRLLLRPEKASRTALRFAVSRMRDQEVYNRADDLLNAANRMPHAADVLAPLFSDVFTTGALIDWLLEYVDSNWSTHEWSVAAYARMIPSTHKARKQLRDYFSERIADSNTSLPLLGVAAQRLSIWSPTEARSTFRHAFSRAGSHHARRVIALAAAGAGESSTKVQQWLGADAENLPILNLMTARKFRAPSVNSVLG
jgi:hypothetical protein